MAGFALAGCLALSIHVGMLGAGVPFPIAAPPPWARWLNLSVAVAAILWFLKLAEPTLGKRSFGVRVLVTFVVLASIRETVRGAIMQGVVTTGWAFAAIGLLEPLTRLLVLALLAVMAVRWVRGAPSLLVAACVTGAACMAAQTLVAAAFVPLMEEFASLGRPALYQFPYPAQVMIPAYLTFAEPVAGSALLLALVWDRLPHQGTGARLAIFAVLVALLKGVVGASLIFPFFTGASPAIGLLSWSQFLFEFLALGLLTGLAWQTYGPAPAPDAGP